MERRGIGEDVRNQTLSTLEELKLVDDRHFCLAWIHTRDALSPRGELVLRQELLQKGIAKELITETLAERLQTNDLTFSEESLARSLLEHKERQFSSLEPVIRRRRQSALLQRRGFSYSVIKRILDI